MQLYEKIISTPVGELRLIAHDTALVAVCWLDDIRTPYVGHTYLNHSSHPILQQAENELSAYFLSQSQHFKVPITWWIGTPFQKQVWAMLQQIPYADTVSYAWLAEAIGRPAAVRAVATAIGCNPLSIIVPCHRVIGKNGALRGFAGGLDNKQQLLTLEKCFSI